MLIRSVLFNFQGAFLNLVAFVCLNSLGDLIIISLSELFVKWFFKFFFEKVLKTFTEGHYPCGLEAPPRFELGVRVLQTHALPLGYSAEIGADYEARTRYLHLGKVALYQMS